jgi:hypothetical protein
MTIPGRMDRFTLSEISLVGAGAQRPALAVIEKAKWGEDQRREAAASGVARADGSWPIADADDLSNALDDYNRVKADKPAIRAHIVARAKALGISDKLPEEWRAEAGEDGDDDSQGALVDKAIRAEIDRGAAIRKADAEGRAQLGRLPDSGEPGDLDDPDEANPYAMPEWDADDDWPTRATKASGELQKRAKVIAKRDGCTVQQGYDKVMRSPAGQALYQACR